MSKKKPLPLVNDIILIYNKCTNKLESISQLDQPFIAEFICNNNLLFAEQKAMLIEHAKKMDLSFPISYLDEETNTITPWYSRAEDSIYGGDIYGNI